ncbi:hypothetical protein HDC90_004314 [Pedobacter sp. AK013]|uniref:HEPN/Toprim-associated domain-containing protein n=1 Tax=Pedobacter sp. AK013 TaxID=2723071 RepID=UPI00161A064A|nr:HEPN/Toprim-associated domain-containing protein [Pedobacter sp. AK013]MBB6239656.1 hypothetical protein [Pedobacter sp. AK013]
MGTLSNLTVAEYPILTLKNNYYEQAVNLLFTDQDFVEEERLNRERNRLVWGDAFTKNDNNYIFKGFKQTASVCKQRLEIYGHTLSSAKIEFGNAKVNANINDHYEFSLSKVTFNHYIETIKLIVTSGIIHYEELYTNFTESLITDELSFHGLSFATYLYCVLSALPPESIIEYELNELIDNGYINIEDVKQIKQEKIIVITEGKTDSEFISASLRNLHPNLFTYYHFIDFSNNDFKHESNASTLVKLITAFFALNIKHYVIAIFDNDTAGRHELKRIHVDKLPFNIKAIKFPNIKLANSYPTIGPTGMERMNINELACGIELYLGEDILKDGEDFIPVQWKGYNDKMEQYQGQISYKETVQSKFRDKLKKGIGVNSFEMEQLLEVILKAFHN